MSEENMNEEQNNIESADQPILDQTENETIDSMDEKENKGKFAARPPVEVTDEHLRLTSSNLASMIGFLGLNADIKATAQGSHILLSVTSSDAGRIIGRKGQTLESLQFILSRMLQKGEQTFPRIYIDIDGYARQGGNKGNREERRGNRNERGGRDHGGRDHGGRNRFREDISPEREESLRQQALDSAKEVMKWGEPVTLPPMNSQERRIIHMALAESTEVKSESIGDGGKKSVVIAPKN